MTEQNVDVYEAPELFELGPSDELTLGSLFGTNDCSCGKRFC